VAKQTRKKAAAGEVVNPVTSMQVRESAMQKAEKARKDAALAVQHESQWGLPNDPNARKALMAITAYYGLDYVMGDIEILGGTTLYITEQAYKKKLEEKSLEVFNGKRCRWVKRPATPDEVEMLGYGDRDKPRVWWVEMYPPEGCGDLPLAHAYGEADKHNMTLQNSTKQTGDPRVLNRMALKRAEHECMREFVTFRLPTPADFESKMGMTMDDMLSAGVKVVLADGIVSPFDKQQDLPELPEGPSPDEVVDSKTSDAKRDLAADDKNAGKAKKQPESEPELNYESESEPETAESEQEVDDDLGSLI